MKHGKLSASLLTILLALLLPISALHAGEDIHHAEARRLQAAGAILPLEKISEIARSFKSGEILETELERNRKTGIYIYEIEILDENGVVWEVDVNASNGELIKLEIED
jgi:uncharacterized membrane protein YkoI